MIPAFGLPRQARRLPRFHVNHGYHAGIAVPRAAFAEQASRHGLSALGYVATRFADFDWLEIGWGDEGFYRYVPAADS